MLIVLTVLAIFLALLTGYSIGRLDGLREGILATDQEAANLNNIVKELHQTLEIVGRQRNEEAVVIRRALEELALQGMNKLEEKGGGRAM